MENQILVIAMVASGLFFGWTIGSHYTGATMGMAYGSGVIKSPPGGDDFDRVLLAPGSYL